jgi:hypothetical protein
VPPCPHPHVRLAAGNDARGDGSDGVVREAEDTLVSMQELSQIQWPDDKRPGE